MELNKLSLWIQLDILLSFDKIFRNIKSVGIKFGIHAHNNFSVGVWNSVIAIQNGANVVDVATRGLGAGAGNTHFEVLQQLLRK